VTLIGDIDIGDIDTGDIDCEFTNWTQFSENWP
jgi:hypothetical protein